MALKQFLEKTWNRWQSEDKSVWYKGQFQYWANINIRDLKNWFCLSSKFDYKDNDRRYTYLSYNHATLIKCELTWNRILRTENTQRDAWTYDIIWTLSWNSAKFMLRFREKIRWFWSDIYSFNNTVWLWSIAPISTPTWVDPFSWIPHTFSNTTAVLNYANTMILVWDWNKLWRYVPVAKPDLPMWWKVIRIFDEDTDIKWLTMEWNYLKIYAIDWYSTLKIHYAKWTFDVEDTWLIQTITINNVYLHSVATDWITDFILVRNSIDAFQHLLYEIRWFEKNLIKKAIVDNASFDARQEFLWWPWENMFIDEWILYCPMYDWIRTFKKVDWVWSWVLQRASRDPLEFAYHCIVHWDYFYISYQYWFWWDYRERRANTQRMPPKFQEDWYVYWRIYDWWSISERKRNIKLWLWYWLNEDEASPWDIRVYLRRDIRSWHFWGWLYVKTLSDAEKVSEEVFTTTDSDFNKNWNYIEYKIELNRWSEDTTPIFNEFNLLYDYVRNINT